MVRQQCGWGAVLVGLLAWSGGAVHADPPPAPRVIDVIGNLPVAEYNQFIGSQSLKDWGNEPFIAVNPTNTSQVVISSFAYGAFVSGSGDAAGKSSIWYSTNGGTSWGIRFPIPTAAPGGGGVPNDQTFAYDKAGNLHGTFLTYGSQLNNYTGSTANPNNDGVNGRPATGWSYNSNRVNVAAITNNTADQPWMATAQVGAQNRVYVGYDSFRSGGVEMRASVSIDNGTTFTAGRDNPISAGGAVTTQTNPGLRIATDNAGNVYSIFGIGDASGPNSTTHVNYRLNMSADGGQTWKFTNSSSAPGGLPIASGLSTQLGSSFGGVNALLGNITAIASDRAGNNVYAVFGMKDGANGTGTDRLWLADFQPDGAGGLIERSNPTAFSVPGERAALPSIAVTDSGKIFVMYDTFANGLFHVYLTESEDGGLDFTTVDLYDFSGSGIPIANGNRLLGDYQFLEALGDTVFGAFSARGDVNANGINTTDKDVPFFFSTTGIVPEPTSLLLVVSGSAVLWLLRRRR
jgi:hypothetical protein